MTRARDLARFANANAISVDANLNVGIGSTTPDAKLDIVGIVSATSFFGDGANITGISSVSFATTSFGLSGTPNITVGVITATSAVVGSAVTINSSGINVVGVLTATSAVVGSAVTINSSGINVVGVITATTLKVGTGVTINAGIISASDFIDDGTNLLTAINTKASTGKAIAMAMVFG